ncbi:hypothetical protein DFH08DRAFT_984407 [Mycena albidolilacea]|uniref:Uncharacterized protein n=1 Tax=Mycena albidolilacea TaxID=1033008 RepID=A0AAD7ABX8_9AGAR|nr:hypothetical protein DFH08DRAFT_984407 [Mycena albidolilacea]
MSATDLSFDDMMHLPLDSSPLKAPSVIDSPLPRTVSISPLRESPTPLPTSTLVARRKRPVEDMTQYAGDVARVHKLVKVDHDELTSFSNLGCAEQAITMMGHILALKHQQSLIQPAEVAWVVPKRLHTKIDEHAAVLIADASIPAYRNDKIGPGKLLMDIVLANPGWGFSAHMKLEKDAMDTLSSEISRVLTGKRNLVKAAIRTSLGSPPLAGQTSRPGSLDIVELSNLIISKLKVRVKVDLRLCGRVAVLRKLITETTDAKYWGAVDTKLADVRATHPDPAKQSKWIKVRILDLDLVQYKHVDLKDLASGPVVPAVPVAGPSTLPTASHDDDDDDNNM